MQLLRKNDPFLVWRNVIIGKLIPAGTGIVNYRDITPVPNIEDNRNILEAEQIKNPIY